MADDFEVAALLKAFYCRWGKENLCKRKAFEWGGVCFMCARQSKQRKWKTKRKFIRSESFWHANSMKKSANDNGV